MSRDPLAARPIDPRLRYLAENSLSARRLLALTELGEWEKDRARRQRSIRQRLALRRIGLTFQQVTRAMAEFQRIASQAGQASAELARNLRRLTLTGYSDQFDAWVYALSGLRRRDGD